MSSRFKAAPLALALVALLLTAATASAQTYTVTRTDDPNPAPCEPSNCSLRGALAVANATTSVDDVIVLPASSAPYLIQYEFLSLPINDDVEIRGAGADKSVVKGDGEEIVFTIATGGVKTTLVGLTITGGKGAVQNSTGPLTLRGVSIEGNEREDTSGGIHTNGPLTVESSFLGYNRTKTATGGAIHANAPVTIVNSTIAHNSSETGPAAIGVNALLTIRNSAVVSNRSEAAIGAGAAAIELSLRDSIFADNRNATGLSNCSSGTPTSLGGNVSDDASCGTGATDKPNVNPLLGTLALHGGTTQVYDLLAGSPAIDAASQCPAVDQRGVARPQGAACDSGPYELVPTAVPPPSAVDREFFMKVGKKLRLWKKTIWVRLTCPPSEVSPPCRGSASAGNPPLIFNGLHTLQARALKGKFSIWPGKTKWIPLRKPRVDAKLLPVGPGRWKVYLSVHAEDGAGNEWKILKKKAPLIGAKPKRG